MIVDVLNSVINTLDTLEVRGYQNAQKLSSSIEVLLGLRDGLNEALSKQQSTEPTTTTIEVPIEEDKTE